MIGDLEAWIALMRASLAAKAEVLEENYHDDDLQAIAFYLRWMQTHITHSDYRKSVEVFMDTMEEWGGIMIKHLEDSSSTERSKGEIIAEDTTTSDEYDKMYTFFVVLACIKSLRNALIIEDQFHITSDVISEMIDAAQQVEKRIPTDMMSCKADRVQIAYFMDNVLESAIREPYGTRLKPMSFGTQPQRRVGVSALSIGMGDEKEDDGGGNNNTVVIACALGAGALLYLNTKGAK
jgi:hypothetical protein